MALFHVIDDEEFMCEMIGKMLCLQDHEVLTFQDPCNYLKFIDDKSYTSPAAVITDLQMPNMDGYELITEISSRRSDQKFLVISATPQIEHPATKRVCNYLCKPFRFPDLIGVIEAMLHCDQKGPSKRNGCSELGDRDSFIPKWHCPLPTRMS